MSKNLLISLAALASLIAPLLACSDDSAEPTAPISDPLALTFTTPEFEVPEGESFTCFYTDTFTTEEMAVSTSFGQQGDGGHHITIYYTDSPQEPHFGPCDDDEMESWRLIAGSGGDDGGVAVAELPEGSAIRVPAGKQLVLQAHYINFGPAFRVVDTATLKQIPLEDVQQFASSFVVLDDSFEIPPQTDFYESVTRCRVPRDINAVLVLGHQHEAGLSFKLEVIDEDDQVIDVLYDEPRWIPYYASHPPTLKYTLDAPLHLPADTRLRQSCTWKNETDEAISHPLEMCVAFLFYFPDQGELLCEPEFEGDPDLTTPAESCVQPGDLGNEKGVGLHCTPTGTECRETSNASLCLAAIAPDNNQWFCTRLCREDADCGQDAVCDGDERGKACIPARCLD